MLYVQFISNCIKYKPKIPQAQRKGSIAEEALKIATGILSRSSASPFPKPGGKKEEPKPGKEPKKGVR